LNGEIVLDTLIAPARSMELTSNIKSHGIPPALYSHGRRFIDVQNFLQKVLKDKLLIGATIRKHVDLFNLQNQSFVDVGYPSKDVEQTVPLKRQAIEEFNADLNYSPSCSIVDARIAMALFRKKKMMYMNFIENSTQKVINFFKSIGHVQQAVQAPKQPFKQAAPENNAQKLRRPPKQPNQQIKGKARDDSDFNAVKTQNYFADTSLLYKQQQQYPLRGRGKAVGAQYTQAGRGRGAMTKPLPLGRGRGTRQLTPEHSRRTFKDFTPQQHHQQQQAPRPKKQEVQQPRGQGRGK